MDVNTDGLQQGCKPLVTFKNRKPRLDLEKHLNEAPKSWNQILWTDRTKINLGMTNVRRKGTDRDLKQPHCVTNLVGEVLRSGHILYDPSGTVFDDMATNRSSRMNSEVYMATLYAHIRPNVTKLIGRHSQYRWMTTLKKTL